MQIKHLSPAQLQNVGTILSRCPEVDDCSVKRTLVFSSGDTLTQYMSECPIILDYVSGMSLLIIYQDGQTDMFYLDRVIALQPGVLFSIMPLGDRCCVELISDATHPEKEMGCISVASLQSPGGLQFEKVYTCFYQECAHNFYFRGEKHQPYELVYVDRGQLHNLVRGQDIILGQQDFMIIDSNDWHTQYSDLAVSFLTLSFWAADTAISAITNQAFSLTPPLKGIFQKIIAQSQQGPYYSDYMEALLKILLIELLQKSKLEPPVQHLHPGYQEHGIVDKAIQIISENIHKKLTLEELSTKIHISVPYLYMLFQEHLGTSPGRYIAKIRIEECKVLLRDGQLSMGQIAEDMGFSSLQHFSRQFKTICGITPTQYVRSLR